MLKNRNKLIDFVERVFIVAYNEDTTQLENALKGEKFETIIIRTEYDAEEEKYSKQSRCLLNHSNAWRQCIEKSGISMVVEADFVPVVGLGQLPMPFDPVEKDNSCAWLYSGSASLWTLTAAGYAIGFSSTNVAILLSSEVAKVLVNFAEEEFIKNDPRDYFPWDTYHWSYLVKNKINPYLPYRSYGEHGGLPNTEHLKAGINPSHQADVLWGKLHFLPLYAGGSNSKYHYIRLKAKFRGFLRLILGKYISLSKLRKRRKEYNQDFPILSMFIFSIKRLINFH